MAAKGVNEAIAYDEFEPLCKWQRNQDQDVLEIHLQGFKKEELKVQISNHGILKISGERLLDASKHSKFYKEIPLPSHKYDSHAIHAKFANSTLIITLPKVKTPPTPPATPKPTPSPPSKSESTGGPIKEKTPAPGGRGNVSMECRKRPATAGCRVAKVAVSLAATAVVVMVLLAYVVYMYQATSEIYII